jgi:hypothetical protein
MRRTRWYAAVTRDEGNAADDVLVVDQGCSVSRPGALKALPVSMSSMAPLTHRFLGSQWSPTGKSAWHLCCGVTRRSTSPPFHPPQQRDCRGRAPRLPTSPGLRRTGWRTPAFLHCQERVNSYSYKVGKEGVELVCLIDHGPMEGRFELAVFE